MTYEIKNDVIHEGNYSPKRGRPFVYPFGKMKRGECFSLTLEERHRVTESARSYGKKYSMRFRVKKVNETQCKCWRVE